MGRRVSAERAGLAGMGKGRFVAAASKLLVSGYRPRSMRAVCQRVTEARVRVAGEVVGEIGPGLCVLLGIARGDSETERFAGKIARLRIFPDAEGRFDRSLLDTEGAALVVSQFTLLADTGKGNRPGFSAAAQPEEAEPLYERFCADLEGLGVPVARGVFGASMAVELVNDGPVTIILDV
jgi:D-aminoacyl-tRNA deacylase